MRYDRRIMKDAPEDLTPDTPAYWEAVLRREGLSMSRGLRPTKLSYVGAPNDVARIEEIDRK